MTWVNLNDDTTLSESVVDSSASNFRFDGLAFRPQTVSQAPATNQFTEVSVVRVSAPIAPLIITQPQGLRFPPGKRPRSPWLPNGTLPLSYQWYYNTNTPVANATNATLTISNVQPADAGGYSVIITNSYRLGDQRGGSL